MSDHSKGLREQVVPAKKHCGMPLLASCQSSKVGDAVMKLVAFGVLQTALLFASTPAAFAQGSTGGTLGKTDQSLSGSNQPKEAPSQGKRDRPKAEAPSVSSCGKIVGVWAFTNGVDVAIKQGGTASATNGAVGRWSCVAGTAVVPWQLGNGMKWTDRYTVAADGIRLSGIGGLFGEGLSATRK